jgi:hypothetical protein
MNDFSAIITKLLYNGMKPKVNIFCVMSSSSSAASLENISLLLSKFPQITTDGPEYAAAILDTMKGYKNPFASAVIYLAKGFAELQEHGFRGVISPFQHFQEKYPEQNIYHKLVMMDLKYRYPTVPESILNDAFLVCCRLYIPAGVYLQDFLSLESDPPTYKGDPFEPLTEAHQLEPVMEQSPHFQHDQELLYNPDASQAYLTAYQEQSGKFKCYPRIPIHNPKPPIVPEDSPKLNCMVCHHDSVFVNFVQCSKPPGIEFCLNCLKAQVEKAIAEHSTSVKCPAPGCTETIPEITLLEQLDKPLLKRFYGARSASEHPVDTAYSGVCPACYKILHQMEFHTTRWRCSNPDCGRDYYIEEYYSLALFAPLPPPLFFLPCWF